jgi:sialic acid synthase SpsE/quercetin dioxygenase-like cupin family protein
MSFDFEGLFIFEMANNHQGLVKHGLRIIDAMAEIADRRGIRGSVKLQYRDLDRFIHPNHRVQTTNKHIPRFLDTRLEKGQFAELATAIRDKGLALVITAFDEGSVETALDHGVDVLKVASCSATDWPLLEVISGAGKPVICSTGGLSLNEVDKVVNFFEHRGVTDLAILHCVSVYPTPNKEQHLNFMRRMMQRYRHQTIGYSGHEAPDNLDVVRVALGMGAKILERHVGLPTETIKLNGYSMNPAQVDSWVATAVDTLQMLGKPEKAVTAVETESLNSLKRGVFASVPVKAGETLDRDKVFFAMPCEPGNTTTSEYQESMVASRDYEVGQPLNETRGYNSVLHMRSIVHDAKGLVREAQIAIGPNYSVELSHHYGIDSFRRIGAVIVNIVNREYCKKLIILLPGQTHPSHCHKAKEETFQILYGEMDLDLEGTREVLRPGDTKLVERGQWHSFSTKTGCIFEEISTTHIVGDSRYKEERINRLDPVERKTLLKSW